MTPRNTVVDNGLYEAFWGVALCGGVLGTVGIVIVSIAASGRTDLNEAIGGLPWPLFYFNVGALLMLFAETDVAEWIGRSWYLKWEVRLLYISQFFLLAVSLFARVAPIATIVGAGALLMLVSVCFCIWQSVLIFRRLGVDWKKQTQN
jgi:hypothetical protein